MKKFVLKVSVTDKGKSVRAKSGDGAVRKGIDSSAVLRTTVLACLSWVVHLVLSVIFGGSQG